MVSGIIFFKLYGDINDVVYGMLVGDVLLDWLFGVFVVVLVVVVLIIYNSNLNLVMVFYVCDIYEVYVDKKFNVVRLSGIVIVFFIVVLLFMVLVYV